MAYPCTLFVPRLFFYTQFCYCGVELSPSQLLLFAFSHYSSRQYPHVFLRIYPSFLFLSGPPRFWASSILLLVFARFGPHGKGGGGVLPHMNIPLLLVIYPSWLFCGAHPSTDPGIPILPLCVFNSPLFSYRYPNVFHARFAPCSLLCMLLGTNKCPNLSLSLGLQYLSTSNRKRNIPPNVPPFTIVQLAEMSILYF